MLTEQGRVIWCLRRDVWQNKHEHSKGEKYGHTNRELFPAVIGYKKSKGGKYHQNHGTDDNIKYVVERSPIQCNTKMYLRNGIGEISCTELKWKTYWKCDIN